MDQFGNVLLLQIPVSFRTFDDIGVCKTIEGPHITVLLERSFFVGKDLLLNVDGAEVTESDEEREIVKAKSFSCLDLISKGNNTEVYIEGSKQLMRDHIFSSIMGYGRPCLGFVTNAFTSSMDLILSLLL